MTRAAPGPSRQRTLAARSAALVACTALVVVGCSGADGGSPDAGAGPTGSASIDSPAEPASTSVPTSSGEDGTDGSVPIATVGLELVTDEIAAPRAVADLGAGRLLVADQHGQLRLLVDGVLRERPFLDLAERVLPPTGGDIELGLNGVAVAPDFAETGHVFVFFTARPPDDAPLPVSRIDTLARWTVDASDPEVADPSSERVLLAVERQGRDHVAGDLAVDGDGFLYLGMGVPTGDPDAQDPGTLPGSVLRLDVSADAPSLVPADNPFASGAGTGAGEVFAYGFRNPWRLSWDAQWGLLASDPMWTAKAQEVERVLAGGNHGYPVVHPRVAAACFEGEVLAPECASDPDGRPLVPPVVEYPASVGSIVSSALVYRGAAVPELEGLVLVSDWRGDLLAAEPVADDGPWTWLPVALEVPEVSAGDHLWTMDADAAGEVYVALVPGAMKDGALYRLVAA